LLLPGVLASKWSIVTTQSRSLLCLQHHKKLVDFLKKKNLKNYSHFFLLYSRRPESKLG
jgi:hypothetical protein